jgi:protein PhnA
VGVGLVPAGGSSRRQYIPAATATETVDASIPPARTSVSDIPPCPKCASAYTYSDGHQFVCPECAHEWPLEAPADTTATAERVWRDANGNVLVDGDSVTVIKDLKIKGSSSVVKVGTKVKNIRLVDGDHDIDCKIDGVGAMKLKSEFVRKSG